MPNDNGWECWFVTSSFGLAQSTGSIPARDTPSFLDYHCRPLHAKSCYKLTSTSIDTARMLCCGFFLGVGSGLGAVGGGPAVAVSLGVCCYYPVACTWSMVTFLQGTIPKPSGFMLQYSPSQLLELNNHGLRSDIGVIEQLGLLRRSRYAHRGSGRVFVYTGKGAPFLHCGQNLAP
ncbi:hypothetical protein Q8A73_014434 [Channa argus]|nr:hypothetical protein Q8A73_014434 [Channa argus]